MTVSYTTNLALAQPVTGTESGTWGDDINNGLTSYLDNAIAGTVTLTNDGAVTLSNTQGTSSGTNIVSSLTGAGTVSAQFAVIRVTGTLTTAKILTAPSSSKTYVVNNAATGSTVTIKASGQTGVSVAVGETATVYFNGTDYVKSATTTAGSGTVTAVSVASANGFAGTSSGGATPALTLSTSITGVLKGNGTAISAAVSGTDYAPATSGSSILYGNGAGGFSNVTVGSGLSFSTGTLTATGSGGTVTSVSWTGGIVTVATGTTTPAFTIAGTSGGIPYFSSTSTWATSAALAASALVVGGGAGAAPSTVTTGTGVVTALGVNTGSAGAFVVNGGALGTPSSGTLTSATGLPISTGVSGLGTSVATALGVAVGSAGAFTTNNAANTFTATQTFNGSTSTFGTSLLDSNETVNVVAAAPSATTNFYVQSSSVQYYTSNAANNWTLNIAFSSGTSMNTALAVGQSVTFTLVTTQSTTAYYNSAVTIDGTSVTPKWLGGAPTAGNASGLDVYRYAVIKTASATYTVLASLTQYK